MDVGAPKNRGLHRTSGGPGNDGALLALDGIDEFLDEVLPGLSHDLGGPAQTLHLRTTDSTEQWMVRAGGGSTHLTRAPGWADAVVTAAASDLLLLLWGRRRLEQVRIDGDTAAVRRFLARADF